MISTRHPLTSKYLPPCGFYEYLPGDLVRSFREQSGMTQRAFGECFDLSRSRVANWEVGNGRPIRHISLLIQLAMGKKAPHFREDLTLESIGELPSRLDCFQFIDFRQKWQTSPERIFRLTGISRATIQSFIKDGFAWNGPMAKVIHATKKEALEKDFSLFEPEKAKFRILKGATQIRPYFFYCWWPSGVSPFGGKVVIDPEHFMFLSLHENGSVKYFEPLYQATQQLYCLEQRKFVRYFKAMGPDKKLIHRNNFTRVDEIKIVPATLLKDPESCLFLK